jgi:hypothetical protein
MSRPKKTEKARVAVVQSTWRAFAKSFEKILGDLSSAAQRLSGARPSGAGRPGRPAGTGRRGRGRGAGAMAAQVLRDWGRPARAGELLPEIRRRGVRVGGANPLATLASTLLKYPGVKRVARGLFMAADEREAAPRRGRRGAAKSRREKSADRRAALPEKGAAPFEG